MKRRGNGEGTITRRKDGRWEGRISLGYDGGKRLRKSVFGKTRREVQLKLADVLRARDRGLPQTDHRITVGHFIGHWLQEVARPDLRPSTYRSYEAIVRLHIEPRLGRVRLAKLRPELVQELLNEKAREGLSPRRVQYIQAVLRTALSTAERWGYVERNVARLVKAPRQARTELTPLEPEEVRQLLLAASGDRLEALYVVTLGLGLRKGEVLGLRWEDINFEAAEIHVRHGLQRVDGRLQLVEPKTKRSRRSLAAPGTVLNALRRHRARQREERLLAGSRWVDLGFVFTTTIGTPLEAGNVTRRFQRLLANAGLRRIRFHDLRHSAATLLLLQGVHPRVVMEQLGHSRIQLTMDTYTHVLPPALRDAAERMDEVLASSA